MCQIKTATAQEDLIIAKHFYQMWLDLDFNEDSLVSDWQDIRVNSCSVLLSLLPKEMGCTVSNFNYSLF